MREIQKDNQEELQQYKERVWSNNENYRLLRNRKRFRTAQKDRAIMRNVEREAVRLIIVQRNTERNWYLLILKLA